MVNARDPEALQNLTREHLLAASREWDSRERVSNFKSKTPREVVISGRKYPTKAIVALAHELAGFGTLTSQQLAGEAARRRLQAVGFALADAVAPSPDPNPASISLEQLQRHHIEAGAAAMRESMEWSIANKNIARKPHETEWRVGIDELWYNPRVLRHYAYVAAGLSVNYALSMSEYDCYRAHLEALGFPVKRGRTPVHARTKPKSAGDLRRVAATLLGLADDADPLQVLLDGAAYPAGALLGLTPSTAPSDQDLMARNDLSTEARREITARIGQGRFRAALMRLHGGCSVTGISTPEVLRAAHIHRWADCTETPAARLDPDNGLLLTANLDALFEAGLIAFGDEGGILISPQLDADAQAALGIHTGMKLMATPSAAQRVYLAKHRDRTCAMRVDETA